MSARIAAGTHAGSSALRSESRPGNSDTAARPASPLEAGGAANVAHAEGASAQDNADGSGGSGDSRHFATALADAGAAPSRANEPDATAGARAGQGRSGAAVTQSGAATAASSRPLQTQTQTQTQTPSGTQALSVSQREAVVASVPGAAAIACADEQDSGDSSEAATTGSTSVDSTSAGPTHAAAHRGRSAGGQFASATDLLSSLALLQGSVASMTAQAQSQVQMDVSLGDNRTLQTIGGASTAAGSNDVGASAGGASGVAAPGADAPSNIASWLTTTAAPAGTEVIAATGTGSTAGASVTGDAKIDDSLAGVAARAASLLPQLLAAIPTSSDSSGVSRSINVPVSDPSWPQALAAQVQWMLGSQLQSATLRLSPAHLGPIQIRIDLQQSQINVSFSAAHADTRSALADAIPRLREMLASGGLTLGQANVQQEAPGGGHARSQGTSAGGATPDVAETVEPVALAQTWALGLVDEYA